MNLNTQFKIYNDDMLHQYLRENSYWYKILNREPSLINNMIQEMKDKYKLNTGDKIERIGERLSMIETLLKVLEQVIMFEILEEADILLDKFRQSEFVQNMISLKETIKQNNLINNKDIKELYKNEIIHKYVENQNILDLHIYYLNKEIKKLMEQL